MDILEPGDLVAHTSPTTLILNLGLLAEILEPRDLVAHTSPTTLIYLT